MSPKTVSRFQSRTYTYTRDSAKPSVQQQETNYELSSIQAALQTIYTIFHHNTRAS